MPKLPAHEKRIPLKGVMSLDCFDVRPSYSKVYRWYRWGLMIAGDRFKLTCTRSGANIHTSVEEVERFVAKINGEAK